MKDNKFKMYNIHTNAKFISLASIYNHKDIINVNVYINISDEPLSINNVLAFRYNNSSVKEIIDLCEQADLAVMYGLDHIKCKISNSLPSSVKIARRLFGSEVYGLSEYSIPLPDISPQLLEDRFDLLVTNQEEIQKKLQVKRKGWKLQAEKTLDLLGTVHYPMRCPMMDH